MSGTLSQEEIDRLMKAASEGEDIPEDLQSIAEESEAIEDEEALDEIEEKEGFIFTERPVLSDFEKDGLGEIGNISMGTASTTLSILLNQEVSITTPFVEVVSWDEILEECEEKCLLIEVNYTKGFEGSSMLIVKENDAKIIADLMMGGDGSNIQEDLTEFHMSAISEAMNQMVGSSATSISSIFDVLVDIAPPNIISSNPEEYNYRKLLNNSKETNYFVKTSFKMVVGDLIDSKVMQLLGLPFALDMFNKLIGKSSQEAKKKEDNNKKDKNKEFVEKEKISSNIELTAFDEVKSSMEGQISGERNIDMLLNVPMEITVELGRTNKLIKDVLNLTTGSILELESFAGEKVDVLVNGKKIALGEVVVVDDCYGVQITDILKPKNRF
jgi:flagellar motor switch protein FliN/FliY